VESANVPDPTLAGLRPVDASGGVDVADALRYAILDGTLPPGTRLRQSQVAEVFGTSRTPVREALHKLNAWGLVDLVVNHAAVVRRVRRGHYDGAFVVWAELEALAVELAIDNAMDIRDPLWAAVAEERKVAEAVTGPGNGDLEAGGLGRTWIDAHSAYHGAVMRAAGSARLQEAVQATTALLTRQTLWDAIGDRPYPLGATAAQHAQVARLIESHDKAGGSECMRSHILGLGEAFLIWWDRTSSSEEVS
jgi:DNA-binding GntR family transcriptional regulator